MRLTLYRPSYDRFFRDDGASFRTRRNQALELEFAQRGKRSPWEERYMRLGMRLFGAVIVCLFAAVLFFVLIGIATAEPYRKPLDVGDHVCTSEADFDLYLRNQADRSHDAAWFVDHIPASCAFINVATKIDVLKRISERKAQVRVISGALPTGTIGWTDAYVPLIK